MKRMQRSVAALLSGAVVASSMTFGAFAADFNDTEGHWGAGAVARWADYGVVQGSNGQFNPDASMTRAEMATVLVNLLGLTEKGENTFSDVQSGSWYEGAILKCAAAGIIKGDGEGANPTGTLNREESAVMLGRALGIQPVSGAVNFGDGAQVSDWAVGYIKAMTEKGIISGTGNNRFAPQTDISRASVTTILDKSISTYVDKPGSYTVADQGIVLVKAAGEVTLTGSADSVLVSAGAAKSGITLDKLTVSGAVTIDAKMAEVTAKDSKLANVTVHAEAGAMKLTGTSMATSVTVSEMATGAVLTVDKTAKVDLAVIEAYGTTTSIAGAVQEVRVSESASDTKIAVEKGATVSKIETAGDKTAVSGSGKVESMTVTGGEGTTVSKETTVSKVENKGDSVVDVGGKEVKPEGSAEGKPSTGGGSSSGGDSSYSTYSAENATALTEALGKAGSGDTVKITQDIGSVSAYGVYVVGAGVKIVGEKSGERAKVYGSFVVKTDGTSFSNIAVYNQGNGSAAEHKNAINAYTSNITIKDCEFVSGNEYANGVMIFPSAVKVTYSIVGNQFIGYDNGTTTAWSTCGIAITGGYRMSDKPFFAVTENAAIPTNVDDKAIIEGNQFTDCSMDYNRCTYTNGNQVYTSYALAIDSATKTDALNLRYAAEDGAQVYIKGAVTLDADGTIKANTTLTIATGATLTIAADATVTNNGTIVVNDAAALEVTLKVGGNVKLGADLTTDMAVLADHTVTLDLNGNDILGTVANAGTLTIQDFSSGATGKIQIAKDAFLINNMGTLTLASGTLENTADCLTAVVCNEKNFTISGGKIAGGVGVAAYGEDSATTMTGGNIEAKYHGITSNGTVEDGKQIHAGYTVDISGGSVTSDDTVIYMPAAGDVNISAGTFTCTGKELKSGAKQAAALVVDIRTGTLDITGGEFVCDYAQDESAEQIGGASGSITGVIVMGKNKGYTGSGAYAGDIAVSISGATITNASGDAVVVNAASFTEDDANALRIEHCTLTGKVRVKTTVWTDIEPNDEIYTYTNAVVKLD